ncbi:MAG: DUF202 domain-containing protein [Candidatus Aminicenantes bacterium]|nr:DUF202 domain-containing protein [Candidatus Aminicenantes bacterium]
MPEKHDEPGLIRTRLANERTLLAYIRTSLAFLAGGLGIVHFFPSGALQAVGWILAGVGIVVLGLGIGRYIRVVRLIAKINN